MWRALNGPAHLGDRRAAPDRVLSRAGVAGFIPKMELVDADLRPYLG
jgi:hypothetical protein